MNRRDKILVICAVSIIGAAVLYGAVHRFALKPARELTGRIETLKQSQQKLQADNHALSSYKGRFAGLRDRTFDDDRRRANVLVSNRINQLARSAGIGEGNYTVTKFSEQRLKDAGWELLCTVNVNTSLDRMVNFLYLLGREERLHRITSLTIRPQSDKRRVHFSLRYSTLVLARPNLKIKDRQPTTQPVEVALNDPGRAAYGAIERRHLWLPYVPRARTVSPPPPPTPQAPPPQTPQPGPRPQGDDLLVVVGLPAIGAKAQIHVASPGGFVKNPLKVGDRLGAGQIAMVDYRVLPMPGNPKEISQSRVIFKIGRNYWAVELGQRIGQRRILRSHELPDALKPRPAKPKAGSVQRPPGAKPKSGGLVATTQPTLEASAAKGGAGQPGGNRIP